MHEGKRKIVIIKFLKKYLWFGHVLPHPPTHPVGVGQVLLAEASQDRLQHCRLSLLCSDKSPPHRDNGEKSLGQHQSFSCKML